MPRPATAAVICERIVFDSVGTNSIWVAKKEMPKKSVMAITAIATIVCAALIDSGALKACTPSEIASMPVSAVQPAAKARSNSQM